MQRYSFRANRRNPGEGFSLNSLNLCSSLGIRIRIPIFEYQLTGMLKVFSVEQIRQADAYTIANEPVASIDLMERAASACYDWILSRLAGKNPEFFIYCGPGNNGGDGLAIARMLSRSQYKVNVAIPDDPSRFSPDFTINLERLKSTSTEVKTLMECLDWQPADDDIMIDALFGSGLTKSIAGLMQDVVNAMNRNKGIVVSVDIPSGLFADQPVKTGDPVVKADYTLSFEFPKTAFFFPENDVYTGEWIVLPIGIHPGFTEQEHCNTYYVTHQGIKSFLKPRSKFSHKGTYGHSLLISGSLGKMGAAVLAARACLRSGTGLLTVHIPECGNNILQTAVPEAMVDLDNGQNECSMIPDLTPYSAVAIGPGIGMSREATNAVRLILQEAKVPLVIDADALNILAEQKTWQAFIPAGSILTPHPREFERLAGKAANGFEKLQLLRDFCLRHRVYVVLKGAHTITCSPGGNCFFNSTGNPGMATGGSGDVLTGIILGLLAQHYAPVEACLLGVYLHGLSGDMIAAVSAQESMVAGDLVEGLGQAFRTLY